MQRRGATADDIIGYADDLLAKHADDSRFELLKSRACVMTGDFKSAIDLAQKAAAHPDSDPAFLKMLTRQLDGLGLFSVANGLLENAARNNPDIQTRDNWVARLLQSGRYTEVLDVITKEKELDTNLLVYKTLALIHLNRTNDAQATVALLAERGKSDVHAAAAAAAIDKTLLHPDDPQAAIAACNDALAADSQDPFFLFLLAKAYDLSGETELAEDHYRQAAINARAWVEPLTAYSKLMLSHGRFLEAFVSAQEARLRSPDDREALVAAATSAVHLIPADRTAEFEELLKLVLNIETKYPDEQRVRPVQALALYRLGKQSEAKAIVQKALTLKDVSPELLLSLASASQAAKLGLEDDCFARCQQLHGMTAQLAFARAAWLFQNGHPDDGLKYLDQNMPQKPDSAWKINHARYLEFTANPQAKKEWEDLAENNPTDVKIQWEALAAKSTRPDRPFIAATIDRLRTLRGDKGISLSIIRARYILQGNPSDKDLAEVMLLLTDVTRQNPRNFTAHQLLANAYYIQKNIPQAIEELAQAADIAPDDTANTLQLAKLLHSQHNFSRARPYIDKVASDKNATVDQRRTCAALLAEEGDLAAAVRQYEVIPPAEVTTNDKLSLASLYTQLNQTAKADALLTELLKQPTPESIQLAVDLYASQKREADAQRALTLLDSLDCPPAVKSHIRAAYAAHFDTPENAIKQFLALTKMTPTDPAAWRQLLTVCIYAGRLDDVDHYAADAHAAVPADEGLTALNANLPLLHAFGADPGFRPIFAAMVQSPNDAPAIANAINLFADLRAHPARADEPVAKLHQLADAFRNILAVQIVAAEACLRAGQIDNAIEIGGRSMQAFPGSLEAAQLSAESLAAAGRWNEALTVAYQWRTRSHSNTLSADVFIARSCMQLNKVDDGLRQIQPYMVGALKEPNSHLQIIILYAQGLLAEGRTEEASDMLKPLLSDSVWRSAWRGLAVNLRNESDAEKWLQYATTSFPSSTPAEKLQLALAYHALSIKTKNPKYSATATSILEPLADNPDCDADTLIVLGSIYESEQNFAGAERIYRRVLKLKPDNALVMNNLAMVIVRRHGNLDEALSLATQAVSLNSKMPDYFDTQAYVLAQQKAYTKALAAIDNARNLAPTDPEWQATRIWLLALSGLQDQAQSEFRQLQLSSRYSSLSASSRTKLKEVGLQ